MWRDETPMDEMMVRARIVSPTFLILLGMGLLFWGGESVVVGAVALAERAGISERVIGLTVVALTFGIVALLPDREIATIEAWEVPSHVPGATLLSFAMKHVGDEFG